MNGGKKRLMHLWCRKEWFQLVHYFDLGDRIVRQIFFCIVLLCLFISIGWADVIKIRNGGTVKGVIQEEGDEKVIIAIKFGTMTLAKDEVESIERASKEENDTLAQKWEKEKQRAEKSQEYLYKKAAAKKKKSKPTITTVGRSPATPFKKTQTATQKTKRHPGAIAIVRCSDNVHSYAACLPSDHGKERKYPVLFCFDPGGDGSTAVRKFAFAAEKYGWIVVGSLNAKNGPWKPILEAQSAMLEDVKKRYNTDQRKYYAAGFSGGARMSYTIAYDNTSNFKGVIACGAGFGRGQISKKISVYHCVGKTDPGLNEVKKAHAQLEKKRVNSKLNIFSGGHSYPPDNVIREAIAWIASR